MVITFLRFHIHSIQCANSDLSFEAGIWDFREFPLTVKKHFHPDAVVGVKDNQL